MHWRKSFF